LPSSRAPYIVLLVFVLAGLLGGIAWHAWWSPAPVGQVFGDFPYFEPDAEFRSTGMYVALAAPLGVVLGALLTWRLQRDPVVTVVSIVLSSVVAGAVMLLVGRLLGPADAITAARALADGAEVRASLRVQPGAPWCAFPAGALVGVLAVLVGLAPEPVDHRDD
jgi:hypothetical protein